MPCQPQRGRQTELLRIFAVDANGLTLFVVAEHTALRSHLRQGVFTLVHSLRVESITEAGVVVVVTAAGA